MDELRLVTRDGRTIPLRGSRLTIGRGADNDLVLNVTQLSRRHAEIQFDGRDWVLVDLGSTNGTTVDGRPLQAYQPALLRPGSTISMGGHDVFHLEEAPVVAIPFSTDLDDLGGPVRTGTPPWIYALAALAAVLLIGVGVLAVLLLNDQDDTNGSATVVAGESESLAGEVVVPEGTPAAGDVGAVVGGGDAPTATLIVAAPPPAPPVGSGRSPTEPTAAPPVRPESLLPTLGSLATSLAPMLPQGTPGAPPGSARYPAPQLTSPQNGTSIQGADALILLTWTSVGSLQADEYYHVSLRYNQVGQAIYGGAWVKDTQWRVPNWLFGLADQGRFEWDVTVRQETRRTRDNNPDGPAISPKSETWVFTWAGEAAPPEEPPEQPPEQPPPQPPTVEPTPTFER